MCFCTCRIPDYQSPNGGSRRTDKSSNRIQHQICHLEEPYMKNQLKAFNKQRQRKRGQGHKPDLAPYAEPLCRCQEHREEEAEGNKDDDVGDEFGAGIDGGMKQPGETQFDVNPRAVRHQSTPPGHDRNIQQEQSAEHRTTQHSCPIHRFLFPSPKDCRQS